MSLRVNHEDEVENITRWRDERCRRASRAASLARAAVLKRVQRSAVTGDADGGRPPIVDKRAHTATGSVASDTVSELCDRLQSYQEIICRQRRVIERCEEECSVWRTRHYDLQHAYDRLLATHRPRTETLPRCSSPSPRFNAVAASFSSLHDVLNEYRAQSSDARACSNDCESDLKLLLTDISRLQDVVVTLGMWRKSVVPIVGNLVMALISAWTLLAAERRTVSELVDLSKEQARTIASLEREVTAARVSLCVCAMLSIIANEVRDASSIVISVQSCTLSRQTTCIKTLEDALHQKAQDIESLQDEFCKARHILSSSCSHLERRCDVITWHNRVLLETSKRSFVEQALTRSWISRFASNLHSLNDHHRTQLQPGSPIYGKPVKLVVPNLWMSSTTTIMFAHMTRLRVV